MPEPAPVFGNGNSITSMPSHEDVLIPPEDVPSLDSGSLAPTLDQSLYYMDEAGPSDDTAATSLEEVHINVECSPPEEDAVSMVPEVPSPLDSGVQFETAVPSPVSTPQVLPELLDPPIVGSALDAPSNVFTPEIIITPKKTHLLVETVHVPLEPTLPVSNDEAVASDGDPLESTTPLSESNYRQSLLVHPPTPTTPSPTTPTHAPAPTIVTPPEHVLRPVEPVHLPAQLPSVVTWSTESKPAPKSEVPTSHERTFPSNTTPQQVEVEDVTPPVQPVIKPAPASSSTLLSAPLAALRKLSLTSKSKPAPELIQVVRPPVQPEPQALVAPVAIKPAPSSGATVAPRKLSLTSKHAPEPIEVVRPPVQPVQSRPEPQVLPTPKPAPSSCATVLSAPVVAAAPRKLSITSKQPEPQQVQVQAVLPPVQPVVSTSSSITKPAPEPIEVASRETQVLTPHVIKPAPLNSATVLNAPVATLRKLSLTSKPAEAVRPPVQPAQSRPEPQEQQVLAAPVVTKPAPSSTAPAPSAPVAAPRKLSLTSKRPEPQQVQVHAVRPPVQPVQVQVLVQPITKPVPASITTVPIAPVAKPTLSSKPVPQELEVVRPVPVLAHPVLQVSTPPVIKQAVAAVLSAPKSDVPASLKPNIASKPAPGPVEAARPPVQPQVSAPPLIKPTPPSSATVAVAKPVPEPVEVVKPPVQPVQAALQVSAAPVIKPAVASGCAVASAPKSDVPASLKPAPTPKPTPEPVEALRPTVQAQLEPHVSVAPVIKPPSSSSATVASAPVAVSHNVTLSSKPEPKPVEAVRPPAQPVQVPPESVVKPTPPSAATVPSAPKNDVLTQSKPILTWRTTEQVEAARTPVQPAHAHPGPKPVPSRNPVAPTASEQARPRVEPVPSPNLPARIPEVPLHSRVETVYRSVQPVSAHQSLTSSTGGRPAPAGSASTSSKAIPTSERTRSQATEAVRTAQQTRPVGNVSATDRTTLTSSGTRSQVAAVPRPVQAARPIPGGSSTVPVRGPVPARSVPSPHIRSQIGAGRIASHAPASRVPSIGSTPAGSAPVPEVSRRVKSHPRKMATTVGQRRSVVMPPPPVTQPTAPPPELPKAPPVQQPTPRMAPQNSSSPPPQGVPTRMQSISSLREAQDKPKIRTAPTPAPAVPTASSAATPTTPLAAAPLTRVDDMARAPTPTLRERSSRMSISDGPTTGRSRRPTIVAEPETPRRAVRASVLSPMNPEQSATGPQPSRGSSSTPISRQDRASVVLPDTNTQKRADPASMPARRDSTATNPAPASRASNAAAHTSASPNGSPTPPPSESKNLMRETRPLTLLPEPAPQMNARLSAQPVSHSRQQQQTEPVTSSMLNSEHVSVSRRSETRKSSYYGSRTEAETPQGEHRNYYSATAGPSRQQHVGNVDGGPVLRSSTQRITSRIRTKDLINRHKPQPAVPPTLSPSVGSPTWSKSPTSATSQPTPTTPDPNRTDSGIEIWDYNSRGDRHRASSDKKGLVDPTKLPTVPEGSDRRSSRVPLHHRDSTMSISKSHSKSSPKLTSTPEPSKNSGSPQVESPASTPSGRGGAFLSRKPQGSFQSGYPDTSTPPRSSTPSSMTHASTAATSTQATLVTPASSFPNLSSLNSKAEPKSWFRRNVLDPFKTRLGLAAPA